MRHFYDLRSEGKVLCVTYYLTQISQTDDWGPGSERLSEADRKRRWRAVMTALSLT